MEENQIISIVIRELTGELSPADMKLLDQIKNNPSYTELKNQLRESWDLSQNYGQNLNINIDQTFDSFKSKYNIPAYIDTTKETPDSKSSIFKWLPLIAIIGLGIFAYLSLFSGSDLNNKSKQVNKTQLNDGVTLALTPGSSVEQEEQKLIDLNGKLQLLAVANTGFQFEQNGYSFFKLNKADQILFEASTHEENSLIKVLKGSLKVFGNGSEFTLEEGQQLLLSNADNSYTIINELPTRINYIENSLSFNRTPLEEVFAEMETYFGISISINSELPDNCHFSAVYIQSPEVTEIFSILNASFNMGVRQTDLNKYEVYNISCK